MASQNSTCLVTGATGFIGVNVVRYLGEKGYNVIGIDLREPDLLVKDFTADIARRITWLVADVTNYEQLRSLASKHKFDRIVHAAIFTSVTKEDEQQRP